VIFVKEVKCHGIHGRESISRLQKKVDGAPQAQNAEEKLLLAYWKSLIKEGAEQGKHGFQYFDKPSDPTEEEEDEEEDDAFELHSCSPNCCDRDCECDDCVRCSKAGLGAEEGGSVVLRGVAG
jgi:hypothetical protein